MTQSAPMTSRGTPAQPADVRKAVTASVVGTVLEWYDFYIYGTAATLVLGKLFFPAINPTAATLAAFATYGIGFFLKPVGGVVLSRFGDRYGRKRVMIISLIVMGLATGGVGLLPTYAQIGIGAPILLVLLRLLQSIGAGAEYGSAITMVAEFSSNRRRGLLASLPALGVSLGILLGTGIFALLSLLPQEAFQSWGWRVPFILGLSLVGVGLYMRLRVPESPEFAELTAENKIVKAPIKHLWKTQRRNLFLAAGARSADAVGGQLYNVFAITYCTEFLKLPAYVGLTGVMAANFVGLAVIPLAGVLCDRFGRRPVYLSGLAFLALFAFPFFWMLETREFPLVVIALVLAYGLGVKVILSTSGAYLAELFDAKVRNSAVTLARTASDPIAGVTPLIATALLAATASYWSVSVFLLVFLAIAFLCVYIGPETRPNESGLLEEAPAETSSHTIQTQDQNK
ncbi:MFS transporter [Pseudarthrobacter sp. NPDC080039]|uniref:MFS transporter n=1 Tax=unclassified Pseudarthrobacter TaxID=2647000 RepID=UPI00344D08DB